jgi:hypothetical protein
MNKTRPQPIASTLLPAEQALRDDFSEWLFRRWDTEPFIHSYIDRGAARTKKTSSQSSWSIKTLSEARDKYIWGGKTFEQNEQETSRLKSDLLAALRCNDNGVAMSTSLAILKWGNVDRPTKAGDRPSVNWIRLAASNNTLCSKLNDAVSYLKENNVERFNGEDLIMDSGLTKILSIADPGGKLIIYDGRVGAALGYLTRIFLAEAGYSNVPECLRYGWGAAQTKGVNRNPSTAQFSFPALWRGKHQHKTHAHMMANASSLIDNICERSDRSVTSRDWESALFMVGYEIPRE